MACPLPVNVSGIGVAKCQGACDKTLYTLISVKAVFALWDDQRSLFSQLCHAEFP